jgi:hypothetical protein
MNHDQKTPRIRHTDDHKTLFALAMFRVWHRRRKGVSENRACLDKPNRMFSLIRGVLSLIPLNTKAGDWS